MKVFIPKNHLKERTYIVKVLLGDFLGLDFSIDYHFEDFYLIQTQQTFLKIEDHFFSQHTDYLDQKNIPEAVLYYQGQFCFKDDLPVIYGLPEVNVISSQEIECKIDLFASSFFMLTRWEEAVGQDKDEHLRFQEERSLAIREGFEHRAIVNEYTELLWSMLHHLDCSLERKKYSYRVVATHDVDYFRRYDTVKKGLKAFLGDILKRKDIKQAVETCKQFFKYQIDGKNDPYDTFDYLMDVSEKYGLKSHFYFMPTFLNEKDARYDIRSFLVQQCIQQIFYRRHIVGVHASYYSYNNEVLFGQELYRLNSPKFSIKEGRQHYLRFENPTTWQIWNNRQLKTDSSLGYYNRGGFRCGCCYAFPVFNIKTRKTLKLKEQPLIAMEGAVVRQYPEPDLFKENMIALARETKLYEGQFVFLWHNHNFYTKEWKPYAKDYEDLVNAMVNVG